MNQKDLVSISKTISYALRHAPEKFGLTLDAEGWVPINDLLAALNKKSREVITLEHIKEGLRTADKQRFEIDEANGRIRAYYGHSIADKIQKTSVEPPPTLYHGTTFKAVQQIMKEGLKPMGRQYVHLSGEKITARKVGARRGHPIILAVLAKKAHDSGIKFYQGNEDIWLSDPIPADYLYVVER